MNNTYVISLGGSLIAPKNGIDWKFLKNFKHLIEEETKKKKRFFIVSGGGSTARSYIEAANKIADLNDNDRDWLGIHATRLNAHLMRTIFRKLAKPAIIKNPTNKSTIKHPIIIGSGWKPGRSTDYVATLIAEKYNIKKIINLSNIDFAYDKDPGKHSSAKKIVNINWKSFRKIVGNKWSPGLNAPFDPIASQKAEQLKLEVVIMNGKKIKNTQNYLNNKTYFGTTIKD